MPRAPQEAMEHCERLDSPPHWRPGGQEPNSRLPRRPAHVRITTGGPRRSWPGILWEISAYWSRSKKIANMCPFRYCEHRPFARPVRVWLERRAA